MQWAKKLWIDLDHALVMSLFKAMEAQDTVLAATHHSKEGIACLEYNSVVELYFSCLELSNARCHWWYHWHHMTLMPTPMTSHDQKGMLHIISVVLTCGMKLYLWWCWWHHVIQILVPVASNYEKVMLHLILIFLTKEMQCCHWQHYKYHMRPGLVPVMSYSQKGHVYLISRLKTVKLLTWTFDDICTYLSHPCVYAPTNGRNTVE